MVLTLLLSGFGGLCVEALAVLWVEAAHRGRWRLLWLIACAQALAQLVGLGHALQGWPGAIAYVLGYSTGPLLGLAIKRVLFRGEVES